jgi:hypothetical protein
MRDGQICRCLACGRAYRVYSMMVGGQSLCSGCRRAAEAAADRPDTPQEKARRARFFGTAGEDGAPRASGGPGRTSLLSWRLTAPSCESTP